MKRFTVEDAARLHPCCGICGKVLTDWREEPDEDGQLNGTLFSAVCGGRIVVNGVFDPVASRFCRNADGSPARNLHDIEDEPFECWCDK